MTTPLTSLGTAEAWDEMDILVQWLRQRRGDSQNDQQLVWPAFTVEAGVTLFRLECASDDGDLARILCSRPAFFATTEKEAHLYWETKEPQSHQRRVMIRATVKDRFRAATADQQAIVRAIYLGTQIGPLEHLMPGEGVLDDKASIRLQRWVVPIAVARVFGCRLAGLYSSSGKEITVAKPTKSLLLRNEWIAQDATRPGAR